MPVKDKPEALDFPDLPKENSIIKVIGVGGGGGNAVNHMYREGIHDVTFVLCNTDRQALNDSPVPVHLQLGTEGLGAGNKPERARKAAEESEDALRRMLDDGTKMAFITAGMGGGTGTGAAPVIARISKEMGILTVGIVTIPFRFEGKRKIDQALDGVEEMAKHVDALLVINNERLREIYPELGVLNAFAKADDTLSVAARSISEIITVHGLINLDFNDVKTVLKDGGVAIMSTGFGEGEGRVKKASTGLMMEEMTDVNDFMAQFGDNFEIKWGLAVDPELGKKVKVTILATGFGIENVDMMSEHLINTTTAEQMRRQAQEAEEQQQKDERRDRYYGHDGKPSKRPKNIFIFNQEDLDNEDVILSIESTPTYRRTRQNLDDIRTQADGDTSESTGKDNGIEGTSKIVF